MSSIQQLCVVSVCVLSVCICACTRKYWLCMYVLRSYMLHDAVSIKHSEHRSGHLVICQARCILICLVHCMLYILYILHDVYCMHDTCCLLCIEVQYLYVNPFPLYCTSYAPHHREW